jgi:TPR repeat protein
VRILIQSAVFGVSGLLLCHGWAQNVHYEDVNRNVARVYSQGPQSPDCAQDNDAAPVFGGSSSEGNGDTGTGVVISRSDGSLLILTARHVVCGTSNVKVSFPDLEGEFPARVISLDRAGTSPLDVALVEVKPIPALWQRSFAMLSWAPAADAQDLLRVWIVNFQRDIASCDVMNINGERDKRVFTYTSTSEGAGYSGAPVLDGNGDIVGIHTGTGAYTHGNLGTAVKIEQALALIEAAGYTTNLLDRGKVDETLPPGKLQAADSAPKAGDAMQNAMHLYANGNYLEAVPYLEQACTEHDGGACDAVGLIYEHKLPMAERDVSKADRYYVAACENGYALGCSNAGMLSLNAKNYADARSLISRGCEGGSPQGCYNLGYLYLKGLGMDKPDYEAAFKAYAKACDGGEGSACNSVGDMLYENYPGITEDDVRAVHFFTKSCNLGIDAACHNLGVCYRDGVGVAANPQQAGSLFRKACSLGRKEDCGIVVPPSTQSTVNGSVPSLSPHEDSFNIQEPHTPATAQAEPGSSGNDSSKFSSGSQVPFGASLHQPSDAHSTALGPLQSTTTKIGNEADALWLQKRYGDAMPLYEAACTTGDQAACVNLGWAYHDGYVGQPNGVEAMGIWSKACKEGYARACGTIGTLMLTSPTGQTRAFEFLEKACNLGDGEGCLNLGTMYSRGELVRQNVEMASQLFKRACTLGSSAACKAVSPAATAVSK